MRYTMNFGHLATDSKPRAAYGGVPFRIALLGDFSGRSNAGRCDAGEALARRKPIKIDVDNIEEILHRFSPTLQLRVGGAGGTVEIQPRSIDDLHPDELYRNVELFDEMSAMRMQIGNNAMFERAAEAMRGWASEGTLEKVRLRNERSSGNTVPVQGRLGDFASLIGRPALDTSAPTPVEDLIKQMVAPYVVAADDPDQDLLLAAMDEALGGAMRAILHHPDFQALESAWRTLDFLVRRVETSQKLQIVVYDVSAEELAADLSAQDDLCQTGLYSLLVEQPQLDEQDGPFSVFIGTYTFEQTPPHAELLARVARLAAAAEAPFVAAIGTDCITTKTDDLHPLVSQAWDALRSMPECAYLSLVTPRFMLRVPYGAKGEPIESFAFEEFNDKVGLRAFLWGNPAAVAAVLLAETYNRMGERMMLGKIMSLGDMPFFFYTDRDGDQVGLPSTERLLSERGSAHLTAQNFTPLLSIKGRPEVRLGSFQSLGGGELLGRWAPEAVRDAIDGAVKAKAKAAATTVQEKAPVPIAAERRPAPVPAPAPVAAERTSGSRTSVTPLAAEKAADELAAAAGDAPADTTSPGDEGEDLDALLAGLDDQADDDNGNGNDGDENIDALLAGLEDESGDSDGGGDDLDALLADLGSDDDGDAEKVEAEDELDALLASLGGDDDGDDDDSEMDPDLAALLDSL